MERFIVDLSVLMVGAAIFFPLRSPEAADHYRLYCLRHYPGAAGYRLDKERGVHRYNFSYWHYTASFFDRTMPASPETHTFFPRDSGCDLE